MGERVLVMGDKGELVSYNTDTNRCGGLHMVTMESEEHILIKQSMPKLHGRMGVTDLRVDYDDDLG